MKSKSKLFILIVLLLIVSLAVVACNKGTNRVSFVVDGSEYSYKDVASGKCLSALPADPEKSGYNFDGWYLDNDVWTRPFNLSTVVISNISVYAHWIPVPVIEKRTFTIIYDSMGGSTVENGKVKEGATPVLPKEPTRKDYNFEGWYLDKSYSVPFTSSYEVLRDLTVYAKWSEIDSSVYFTHTGHTLTGITEQGKKVSVMTLPTELDGMPITAIRGELFKGNTALTKITIPVGYTTIGASAFKGCTSLETVFIGDSVVDIGNEAFSGCRTIKNLQLPTKLNSIPDLMCQGCTSLAFFNVGGATAIGKGAYKGCASLTSIAIPAAVKTIGEDAFRDCTGLTGVAMREGLEAIGASAFRNCARITSVIIPDSVTSIGEYAFAEISSATDLKVGKGVTVLPPHAFQNMSKVDIPVFDGTITEIGEACFSGMFALVSATFADMPVGSTAGGLVIPDSVTTIGKAAFQNCTALRKVTLPSTITFIPNRAFAGCLKLTTLDLSSVTDIGSDAFNDCCLYKGANVEGAQGILPDGLVSLGSNAFHGCSAITSVTIPAGITKIHAGVFEGCKGLAEVIFHNGITDIGSSAFEGCESLTSIDLPDSLTNLTDRCFAGCFKLENVEVGENVSSISSTAFYGCVKLGAVDVVAYNSVYESVNGVLLTRGREVLVLYPHGRTATTYTMPAQVKEISENVFKDNDTLEGIVLSASLERIGASAFYGCTKLSGVTFPDSLKHIGQQAFYGCTSLTDAILNVGLVELETGAFRGCGNLTSAVIPATVLSLGSNVFYSSNKNLKIDVDFPEKEVAPDDRFDNKYRVLSGWSGTWYDSGRTGVNYDLTFSAANEVSEDYEYALRDGKAILTKYIGSDTEVVVPSTVDGYPVKGLAITFENNTSVTSVSVPSSVDVITERTFNGCTALTSLVIPFAGGYRGAKAAGALFGYIFDYSEDRFAGWSEHFAADGTQNKYYCNIPASVTSVTLTDCTELGYGAFSNTRLTSVTLPDGLTTIKTYALYNIKAAEINIPATVTDIAERAVMLGGKIIKVKDENDKDVDKNVAEINCAIGAKPEGWVAGWYVVGSAQEVRVQYGV